jgi:hypothetical protein
LPILFGFSFTVGYVFLGEFIPHSSTSLSLIFNAAGVTIMYQLFWNRHIGKNTKYRAKPIWIPLIIGIILMVPLIYFAVQGL